MSYETLVHELEQMQYDMELFQKEVASLKQKLEKAIEALKFYANADVYEWYDKYESTAVQHDGGEFAQKVLKEIEG